MRFILILCLIGLIPFSNVAQSHPSKPGSNFPMALDSFYMQVKFVDGQKIDYEAFKTKDSVWLVADTVLYNMMEFPSLETMFMFLMHAKGTVAKNFIITPMLPRDISKMLVNRQLYLRDSLQGRLSHNY